MNARINPMKQTPQRLNLMRVLSIVFVSYATLSGCALTATKTEYSRYRSVRLAQSEQDKLVAMQSYMAHHPDGVWSEEIAAYRQEAEPNVWQQGRNSYQGLSFYLKAFPDGSHVAEAKPRLAALATVEARKAGEEKLIAAAADEREAAAREYRATWVSRAAEFWAKTLLELEGWGEEIPAVAKGNPEFNKAYGRSPRPRCSREECVKFYYGQYSIPVPGGTRLDRQMQMYLRLKMDDGQLERAEFLLPNKGFSRWYEQEHRTAVVDEDPEQRKEAIDWAISQLEPAVEAAFADAKETSFKLLEIEPPKVRAPGEPEPIENPTTGETEDAVDPASPESAEKPPETLKEIPKNAEQTEIEKLVDEATEGQEDYQVLAKAEAARENEKRKAAEAKRRKAEAAKRAKVKDLKPRVAQALEKDGLRLAFFFASPDDNARAYDGFVIERVKSKTPAKPRGKKKR